MVPGLDPHLRACLPFGGDVDLRGRVLPHKDGRQPGRHTLRPELLDLCRDLTADLCSDGLSVDDARSHVAPSVVGRASIALAHVRRLVLGGIATFLFLFVPGVRDTERSGALALTEPDEDKEELSV